MSENRVTIERIESKIKHEEYILLPDGRTTICILTLENGFTVKGWSACVAKENYNKELGEKYAREDAIDDMWQLEGYLLAQELYEAKSK